MIEPTLFFTIKNSIIMFLTQTKFTPFIVKRGV